MSSVAFESDTAFKAPIDEHVQSTLSFVQQHEEILARIDVLNRHTIYQNLPLSNIANATETHQVKPIKILSEGFERILPQDLICQDTEHTAIQDPGIKKAISVLLFLCDEISQLVEIAESRFYKPTLMFGVKPPSVNDNTNESHDFDMDSVGIKEKMMGKFLPFLQEMSNFVDRCYNVTLNLVQQLASLMNSRNAMFSSTFKYTQLVDIYTSLGETLTVLISLDALIQQNEVLCNSWSAYKSMVVLMRAAPEAFNATEEEINKFERVLVSIDQSLMIGDIFRGCVEQNFEVAMEEHPNLPPHSIKVRNNEDFMTGSFLVCLRSILETSVPVIGTNTEQNERYALVGVVGMYVLYRRLMPSHIAPDEKLFKAIWGLQKAVPAVMVCGNVMWLMGDFIRQHADLTTKNTQKLDPPNPGAFARQYLQNFDKQFSQRSSLLISQSKAWMVLVETRLQPNFASHNPKTSAAIHEQLLDVYSSLLLKGLSLVKRCALMAKTSLTMHASMQVPMSRQHLADTCLIVETIKALQVTFVRKDQLIAEVLVMVTRSLCAAIHFTAVKVCARVEGNRKSNNTPSAANLYYAASCLCRLVRSSDSFTASRRIAVSILLQIVVASLPSGLCNEKERGRLRMLCSRLSAVSALMKDLAAATETAYLLFHLDILPPLVESIYQLPTESNRLQYICSAFEDGILLCRMVLHTDVSPFFLNYRASLRGALQTYIVEPLCRDIETDLRLHVHTKHLAGIMQNTTNVESLVPLRSFLDLAPIRLLGVIVDIKYEVTHYLDKNFYNLTTVALHDWRTYSDMRSLAKEKLDLDLMDNFLPMGSLDQGLDVLQIMRNIHVFVGRFTYNMNMQQFVEFRPDRSSKHLNTIKIQSIAASIRQHGLGVLNTTVNFTYQFLSSKFKIFSQFLFDDYIRAHLSREHRWYKKHKNEPSVNNRYPYDRALKFVREIRKLGVNEAGKSFLDQFRILVTEIGNALGYVRMVRSAAMYYCSEAVKFLPDFEDIINFKHYAGRGVPMGGGGDGEGNGEEKGKEGNDVLPGTGAGLSAETVRAAGNLDDVISTLVNNFGEGNDYFKVLVNVFQSVLLSSDHSHLKAFHMIVPALCISWTEAALVAKDAMYKTNRGPSREMYYTDDGFAVGIAYCLAILKQTRRNESLHWIETVTGKIKTDAKELMVQQDKRAEREAMILEKAKEKKQRNKSFFGFMGKKTGAEDEDDGFDMYEDHEEVHTLQTTGKKLEAYRRESEQLFYSMSGAEIFFKRIDNDTS